jgi:hypothetical protein
MRVGAGAQGAPPEPSPFDERDALAPSRLELGLLFIALLAGGVALSVYEDAVDVANVLLPTILSLALAYGNYRMAVDRVATILTPTFAARTAMLFYGGIGSLFPLVANDAELAVITAFFAFDEFHLLKYNMVVVLFVFVFVIAGPVLAFISSHAGSGAGKRREHPLKLIEPSNFSLFTVGAFFVLLGTAANLFFVLPFQFGLSGTNAPVTILQVANSAYVGLFLCTIWCLRHKSPFTWVFIAIGCIYSLIGLSTFAKSEVILPAIMLSAAFVYVRPKLSTFAVAAVVVVAVFSVSQPIVSYGRSVLVNSYGSITGPAGLAERVDIIRQYVEDPTNAGDSEENYALMRFSYVNVGTFVIADYDAGSPGTTLSDAYAIFIPRIIWPDKPVLTDAARQLNYEATGNDQSSVATGLAPEAYWNGGWAGVVLAALVVGMIFWLWSIYSLRVQSVGAWHLFPVVLVGIRAGTRFDGFFVVDVLGPLLIAALGHFVLMIANRLIHRFGDGRRTTPLRLR